MSAQTKTQGIKVSDLDVGTKQFINKFISKDDVYCLEINTGYGKTILLTKDEVHLGFMIIIGQKTNFFIINSYVEQFVSNDVKNCFELNTGQIAKRLNDKTYREKVFFQIKKNGDDHNFINDKFKTQILCCKLKNGQDYILLKFVDGDNKILFNQSLKIVSFSQKDDFVIDVLPEFSKNEKGENIYI